jgi:hypothetical protein
MNEDEKASRGVQTVLEIDPGNEVAKDALAKIQPQ